MIALAAAAHPDDIEFMMAGTLLRLKDAGCEIHLWNLANGCCGSNTLSRGEAAAVRWSESQASAACVGGTAHPPLFNDLEVFYDQPSLAKVAAVIRRIQPDIILTQSPQDYMEDHQNTVRLVVSGAFTRGMKNFPTDPTAALYEKPVALYHALPHGLNDALRLDERKLKSPARPGFQIHFYDTVQEFYASEALEYIDAWRQSNCHGGGCHAQSRRCRVARIRGGRVINTPGKSRIFLRHKITYTP
jgi:LmbE family N-acetylglucosaminyl deacetylase